MTVAKLREDLAVRASAGEGRVAVIDIGSNSIRLVVFNAQKRAFLPLFNEKVICGLGRGLQSSGHLSKEGVKQALPNLQRFAAMARAMDVAELHMVATAASRDADNGPEFISEVERRCEHPVTIISGAEEARLAALGVLSGLPDADGVMGDLGGGSLELVALDDGRLGASQTMPLGPLRLMDIAKGRPKKALNVIEAQFDKIDWLPEIKGRDLYAVGGAWRNLARLHMEQNGYPLHMLHGYALPRDDAEQLCRLVAGLGKRSLGWIEGVSRRRAETLPYAALVLGRLLRRCRPARLVLSAYGLREGLVFDHLSKPERAKDPLIQGAKELAVEHARFANLGGALVEWTDPLFPKEPPKLRRLREAACHLSDVAWRDHPDYRADQALRRALHYPFMALDHPGRAFMARVALERYGGGEPTPDLEPSLALILPDERRRARVIGIALRLAYTLSAGVPSLLKKTSLRYRKGRLRLELPSDGSIPSGMTVEQNFQSLVDTIDAKDGSILT
ncbi:MAG: exopolyphosphatase [Pseudomonadota bacterium]